MISPLCRLSRIFALPFFTVPVRAALALLLVAALSVAAPGARAQGPGTVEGRVRDARGEGVPFATVTVRGTASGANADAEGRYRLAVAPGAYTLVVSAVGFVPSERSVTVAAVGLRGVDFRLADDAIGGGEVVVTGTIRETFVRDSPVRVDVVSSAYLDKIPTANLMNVISNVNGLRQQIDCGVCGTNNIRINGMDGPYTAVLIDGAPIMSSLGTVYGLNGISPALIQQIEVVKGPMSTLYGSEALAGVINVITKNPRTAPRLSVNTFATSGGETALDIGGVPTRGRVATLVSGTFARNARVVDDNGDDFADLALSTRASVFGKASFGGKDGRERASLSARLYAEDRRGGTRAFLRSFADSLRGSARLYGETIRTNRAELIGSLHLMPRQGVRLDVAANRHDQDSYYGESSYQATQETYVAQIVAPMTVGRGGAFLAGATARYQRYDDNTVATEQMDAGGATENRPDNRFIPGLFAQHEQTVSRAVRGLVGLRADHQPGYGAIVSPRASLQLRPAPATTVRLNGGTGFRVVNLFTEDHAAYSGARATLILEDLRPERSVSGTASVQHIVGLGGNPLTIDVDGFYTRFTNKIEPDYGTPGQIRYANLDGSATTRGLSVSLAQSLTAIPLTYTVGATWMDVFVDRDGARTALEFAPDYQAVANATLHLPRAFALDYTATLTGPMALPAYASPFERPTRSPVFGVHNLRLSRELHVPRTSYEVQLYAGAENLFDYTQPSPLIDPANPFGPSFDTAYVYGPVYGRTVSAGLRVTLAR